MLNFKKRKTAALLAFVSMLGGKTSMSKALEVTKNPGVTKTLAAEKTAGSNSKMKIVIDWVKDHKVLTGGIATFLFGSLVAASVFLAKHIKNKNKIENNDDKPDNSNSDLNKNDEENDENKIDKNRNNNNSEISSKTDISNEKNDENNLNDEENENIQIQIENKKENIINLSTNMENDNDGNKNIIIINKKLEENKINENTQTKNLNIEEKNKNIINLENNDKNKNIMINNGNVDLKVNKKNNKNFNNNFKINRPNTINLLHYKRVMFSFDKLRQKISSLKLNANCFASLIGCFNNNYKLESINLQKNNEIQNLKLSYDIHIKTNKTNYQINFEMSGDYVDETKVTVKNMTNKSKKTLNIK